MPIVPPPIENRTINTGRTISPRPRQSPTIRPMAPSIAPVALSTPKVPPMRKM